MIFLLRSLPLLLSLIVRAEGGAAYGLSVVDLCTESSVCFVQVCPGNTFSPVCSEVNTDFYIDLTKPLGFAPVTSYSICSRMGSSGSSDAEMDACPPINATIVQILTATTSCFIRKATLSSCVIKNPTSLNSGMLPDLCFKTDRELSFSYYCKAPTTTVTPNSTTSPTKATSTTSTSTTPTSTTPTSTTPTSTTPTSTTPTPITTQKSTSPSSTMLTTVSTTLTSSTKSLTPTYSSTIQRTFSTTTAITSVTPSVKTATSAAVSCPSGTVPKSTGGSCTPVTNVAGEACRQLAAASGSVYQTENGSCAQVPNSVDSVSDMLKSTTKVTVRAQLLSKFAEAQNFSDIKDVSGFALVLSEQLPSGSNEVSTTKELQTAVENLLSSVTEFSSKGLWTSGSANGSAAAVSDSQRTNMTQAADTVLKAIDNLGAGLQDNAQAAETIFNSSGIGLSLRRLGSQSTVSSSPDPDIAVRVFYNGPGTIGNVSVVTTSVNLPNLLQWLRPKTPDQRLVSRVVQASLFISGAGKLPNGGSALFIVPHSNQLRLSRIRRSCVFVDSDGVFSDNGCSVVPEISNETHTACLCRHLTSFAVVASPGDSWLSVETQYLLSQHSQPLRILTYACLSVSVFCLMLTCFAYMALRMKSQNAEGAIVTLYQVHKALCATLMVAQLLFVIGFERVEYGKVPCQVLSALTLYGFLSVFAWLLLEAFMYTRSLIVVLPNANSVLANIKFWHYCLLCYLVPAIITAVTAGVRPDKLIQMGADLRSSDGLESPTACWLSSDMGTRWAFLAPMLAVCATNLILFIVILVKISRRDLAYAAHEQDWDVAKMLRRQLRVSLTLGALLGLSWLISLVFLFAQMELLLAANYLFILLNGLQGCSILITQVLVHRRMRDAWERWLLQSQLTPHCLRLWLENRRAARQNTAQGGSNGTAGGSSRVQWQVAGSCCCCCLGGFGSSDSSKSTSAGFSDSSGGSPTAAAAIGDLGDKLGKPQRPPQHYSQTLGDTLAQFVGPVVANQPIGLSQPPMMEVKSVLFYDSGSCQRCAKVSHF